MQGKRSYAVVRKFVLQACEQIETKGLRLSQRVFVPEPFVADRAAEIASRHRIALSPLSRNAPSSANLMIVVGELKMLAPTALGGHRLILRHLPDRPLIVDAQLGDRVKRVFEREFTAWSSGQVKVVSASLIHARDDRCYATDERALTMTSREWIPLAHVCDADVVAKLVAEERTFVKSLNYDAPEPGRLSNFLLLDAGARPVALDIASAFMSERERERSAKLNAVEACNPKGWVWDNACDAIIPELPPVQMR
jgi:hypothetical protein